MPPNSHSPMELSYEFAYRSKSQLGPAAEQTLKGRLAFEHLYTNSVLFNFSYLT
ncbi:hypothetical protein [uncultured Legionella sp.]|uniref:hypothetical protein n=1 Tax=uncultured Legionella sp. TaxID=210934 RepID=UPI0026051B5E|nr:hypothetical protein [uncultured Legionella sp.]